MVVLGGGAVSYERGTPVGGGLVREFEVPLLHDKSERETVHETVQGSQQRDRSGVSLFASNFCTAFIRE